MARSCWMLSVAWSLTLSLLSLKGSCSHTQSVQLSYQDPRPCTSAAVCLNTSNCNDQMVTTTQSSLFHPFHMAISPTYSHARVTSLVTQFKRTLMNYRTSIEGALEQVRRYNGFSQTFNVGLQNLYPLSRDTNLLTASNASSVHQVLRESRWLLTSVEAHIQVLLSTDVVRAGTKEGLGNGIRHVSGLLTQLLIVFNVSNLPAQATCVQYPSGTIPPSTRIQFTVMALHDISRALQRILSALAHCEVRPSNTHRHGELHCQSSGSSVFYRREPPGILYYLSNFLA